MRLTPLKDRGCQRLSPAAHPMTGEDLTGTAMARDFAEKSGHIPPVDHIEISQ